MNKQTLTTIGLSLLTLLFSYTLMFHTFSYDANRHEMRIASKAWSDFGAHIPLIRSFSRGPNFDRLFRGGTVESPLFPGEPIRYHYGFYALVGIMERLGLRIDWALNTASAIGFAALLILIYTVSLRLFANRWTGMLSVLFFLSNGSLSFVEFFRKHPPSPWTLTEIMSNSHFPSFGPWDNGMITAFWNLNIYTNQRHLAFSYAVGLGIFLLVLMASRIRRADMKFIAGIAIGTITIFLWWLNEAVASAVLIAAAGMFMTAVVNLMPGRFRNGHDSHFPHIADWFAVGFGTMTILFLPVITGAIGSSHAASSFCYLAPQPFSVRTCAWFWFQNLGLHMALIPLGLLIAPRTTRKILTAPLLLLFLVPNLMRLSPDMINNHKFFNFFMVLGNMCSAYAVVRISAIKRIGTGIAAACIILLILSGIIDAFPVINDTKGSVADIQTDPDAAFIATHTRPTDVIANSTWFYHPASIAGRSILSGYTYFTWSYGYDQSRRESQQLAIYATSDAGKLCPLLTAGNIRTVEINRNPESFITVNHAFWDGMVPAYENSLTGRKFYQTDQICTGVRP